MADETSEIKAGQKYDCPSCGAEAKWNPAKHALVCPFCGTESPAKLTAAGDVEIHENDLLTALREIGSDQRGLQTEKKAVQCQSCEAISLFDPQRIAQRCEFCGSAAIIPIEQQNQAIRPQCVLEFKVAEDLVRDKVRGWYGSRWFAPNALKRRALTDTVRGIYLPYWTFDAQVHADWTADSGYFYYETETYRDNEGRTQTRQVQQTRWVPTSGMLDHFFKDELVPASRGVASPLLKKIEPFPTHTDLKPYDPGYLAGWVVEQYQIDLVAAANAARAAMDRKTRTLCSSQVPGDTQRSLSVTSTYSAQTFKHVLLPVWVLGYTYGAKSYQLVVNGYTGSIGGKYPLSWVKIMLAVLSVILLLILISALSGHHH